MKKIQWGILSTARINRRLIPEIHASARAELRAVASRDIKVATDYATEWKIPKAYGSYEELLADNEIDVVYVSLPNDLHAKWVVHALQANKHVLCEKPLCLSLQEFGNIRRASTESGKTVMEAFMNMHHPQTAFFKSLVQKGEIGTLVAMQSQFTSIFNRPADNYRMDASKGGGALWDIGVYPVSFFQYIAASQVASVSSNARLVNDVDMSFWGRMDFKSGVSGQFFASFESAYSTQTSLMGTAGRIDITHPYNAIDEAKAYLTKEEEKAEITLPKGPLYAGEIENMNEVALGVGTPRLTLDDSRKVLETVLRLRKAAGLMEKLI